ncbi:hypothetical protein GW943_02830 [Candidatus Parcubacteria bacterium]|uniref:Uncharacterized protein n=1 Tax=Candidatus Kaiserbacteria bacterium CG10_big_fil_rev_8_21_14_0_10_47_16 TaxID=1974608 RepID=A0A2H0UDZ1_9BACT|nr:hypothetical protein [Candidatus Parcubacteria bacterium]PIR84611.1 MAG: hypothetical protein COU16_03495 [Candidatus Kaiserbacteria bacterium CG10_big_fil_rev_8_21_14_0_10_47_16]
MARESAERIEANDSFPSTRVQNAQAVSSSRQTVHSDFAQSKSLQAKVHEQRFNKPKAANDNFSQAANDNSPSLTQRVLRRDAKEDIEEQSLAGTILSTGKAAKGTAIAAERVAATAVLLYSIAAITYVFIFIFGVIALGLIYAGTSSVLGVSLDGVVKGATTVLSWFGLGDGGVGVSDIGGVLWAFAVLFAFIGYLVIGVIATFTLRTNFLDSSEFFLVTVVTLGASMAPVSQLFPWIAVWVFYIQATTITKALKKR